MSLPLLVPPFLPCFTLSHSDLLLFLRTFPLAVSSALNTSPHKDRLPPLSRSPNVTFSVRPFLTTLFKIAISGALVPFSLYFSPQHLSRTLLGYNSWSEHKLHEDKSPVYLLTLFTTKQKHCLAHSLYSINICWMNGIDWVICLVGCFEESENNWILEII